MNLSKTCKHLGSFLSHCSRHKKRDNSGIGLAESQREVGFAFLYSWEYQVEPEERQNKDYCMHPWWDHVWLWESRHVCIRVRSASLRSFPSKQELEPFQKIIPKQSIICATQHGCGNWCGWYLGDKAWGWKTNGLCLLGLEQFYVSCLPKSVWTKL